MESEKHTKSIWVDADACPKAVREILIRAAKRTSTPLTFVANQPLNIERTSLIKTIQVSQGFDIADNYIVNAVSTGDLVITQDIPLASEVIDKGADALGTRGQRFTADNIKARLGMRDFMETLRSSGIQSGGPPSLSQTDVQQFANHLDRWLRKNR